MDGADGRRQGEQVTESNPFLKIWCSIHAGPPAIPARLNAFAVLHGFFLTRAKVARPQLSGKAVSCNARSTVAQRVE